MQNKVRYGDSKLSLGLQQVRLGFSSVWTELLKQTAQ